MEFRRNNVFRHCVSLAVVPLALVASTEALAECEPSDERKEVAVRLEVSDLKPTALTVVLDYAEETLTLPGHGMAQSVVERVDYAGEPAVAVANDQAGELKMVIAGTDPIATGAIADVTFSVCAGAGADTIDSVPCRVESCSHQAGKVDGCSCSASVKKPKK